MRNLLKYPITKREVLEYLKDLEVDFELRDEQPIGDIRPIMIQILKKIVEETDEKRINELTF